VLLVSAQPLANLIGSTSQPIIAIGQAILPAYAAKTIHSSHGEQGSVESKKTQSGNPHWTAAALCGTFPPRIAAVKE
jgi:hypothetical protein